MARLRLLAVALAAALLAGCGSHTPDATDAAQLVPADAQAYLEVAPNGLARATAALAPFGAAASVFPPLRPGRTAILRGGAVVRFARPADRKAYEKALEAKGLLHARVRGWVVSSTSRAALDAVRRSRRSLADTVRWNRARKALPRDALAFVYRPARAWRAAELTADGGDTLLRVARPVTPAAAPGSTLTDEIPAAAVAAISVARGGLPPWGDLPVRALGRIVGADARPLLAAAPGPYVLYAAPGEPVPDVTFAAAGTSPRLGRAARAYARALIGGDVPPSPGQVDLGPVVLHYGPLGGQTVVSVAGDAGGELLGGTKLTGNGLFRDAAAAAALPDDPDALLYVDARRTLAGARAFSALAGGGVPPALERVLAPPLRALLTWRARTGAIETTAYLRAS